MDMYGVYERVYIINHHTHVCLYMSARSCPYAFRLVEKLGSGNKWEN